MKKILKLNNTEEDYENKKERIKKANLKSRYNITLETYNNMLLSQDNKCKICGTIECKTGRALSVDHCHNTSKIRGLLCANCNTALGLMGDDVVRMRKAIKYLKKPWHVKIRKRYATLSNRLRN